MPANMAGLLADLTSETQALLGLVDDLDEPGWHRPTPAPGWDIADQVSHLAYFDDAAVQAATDPEGFAADLESAVAAGELSPDDIAQRYRSLPGAQVLAWFGSARARLTEVFADLGPSVRVPWFGPPMSAASCVTARLMETWAHGQDVADTLGRPREATSRLRHVAHLGVRALAYSFAANGMPVPGEPVHVELAGPAGDTWAWGPPDAVNRVSGPALDFCLLVTQRRHRDDTALRADGPVARQWLGVAQAFAGPPGPGRPKAGNLLTKS